MEERDPRDDRMNELTNENHRLRKALRKASILVSLLTIRQVVEAGDAAIDAAGLNPWCMNEGRATGDEKIYPSWAID